MGWAARSVGLEFGKPQIELLRDDTRLLLLEGLAETVPEAPEEPDGRGLVAA